MQMGFVKFVVDVLAWPLFALVYPLCASIRAIEIDSSSDTKKLVAYWVLFALLFLFEYSFVNLLQWIPFWLYIKLMISVWKEFFFKRNEFESEVKRCVKENRPEAQEELLLGKVKLQIASCAQEDLKTVEEVTERKDAAAAKKLDPTEPALARMENKVLKKTKEISETVKPSVVEHPQVPLEVSNKFQKRICPLCQVTAESETTWNSHIQGKRHAAALNLKKEIMKNEFVKRRGPKWWCTICNTTCNRLNDITVTLEEGSTWPKLDE